MGIMFRRLLNTAMGFSIVHLKNSLKAVKRSDFHRCGLVVKSSNCMHVTKKSKRLIPMVALYIGLLDLPK